MKTRATERQGKRDVETHERVEVAETEITQLQIEMHTSERTC